MNKEDILLFIGLCGSSPLYPLKMEPPLGKKKKKDLNKMLVPGKNDAFQRMLLLNE
jgi:hypothetical protein